MCEEAEDVNSMKRNIRNDQTSVEFSVDILLVICRFTAANI
jgi:hypothetical protein